jgi:hypothetical protein
LNIETTKKIKEEIVMKIPFKFVLEKRNARLEDLDQIIRLDNEVWKDFPATRETIESRIRVFPEGNFVGIINGKIVGYAAVQLIDYDINDPRTLTWNEITDNGTLKSTHNDCGNIIFGVADTVYEELHNFGIGYSLFMSCWKVGVSRNVRGGILGSRIPLFHQYSDKYSVEEYIGLRREDGKPLDPALRMFESDGFIPIKIVPNYIEDPDSENFGVLVYQKNPFYNFGNDKIRRLIGSICERWGHKILESWLGKLL